MCYYGETKNNVMPCRRGKITLQLKTKKQVNGKNIAVFDTQDADIAAIVEAMSARGWTFDILFANYKLADGSSKKKDIPASKCAAVQARYNIDNWAFKAHLGGKTLAGQMDNSKHLAAISQSTGGAIKDFMALPIGNAPVPAVHAQPARPQKPMQAPQQKSAIARQRDAEAAAAARALLNDEQDAPEITPMQREARRAASRAEEQKKMAAAPKKKHTALLILSILECLTPSFVFGGMALYDVIKGRRFEAKGCPIEAAQRFKEVKFLLVFGLIATIAFTAAFTAPSWMTH